MYSSRRRRQANVDDEIRRVERASAELTAAGQPVTFTAVAARSGLGRTTLYRRRDLRALVEEHRARTREANTLSGLTVQVDQLRQGVEALAAKVRRHEEILRVLHKAQRLKAK